jgi:hypothetical protein
MKYPKVPKPVSHIIYAIILTLLVIVFLYLINPELQVASDVKRFIVRASSAVALSGVALGAYSINWGKKNRRKLFVAQREILDCTEVIDTLSAGPRTAAIAAELTRLGERKDMATKAMDEASRFDQDAATVGLAALAFVVVSTVLQAIAA